MKISKQEFRNGLLVRKLELSIMTDIDEIGIEPATRQVESIDFELYNANYNLNNTH